MRKSIISTILALGLVAGAAPAIAQSPGKLSINISGLRSDSGVVRCGLYASADGFRQLGREQSGVIARPSSQRATCVFNGVRAGTYAVAVFHAERNETQMEYGMFGKPKQGYGFSRNPSSSFGPPNFEAAAFQLSRWQPVAVRNAAILTQRSGIRDDAERRPSSIRPFRSTRVECGLQLA